MEQVLVKLAPYLDKLEFIKIFAIKYYALAQKELDPLYNSLTQNYGYSKLDLILFLLLAYSVAIFVLIICCKLLGKILKNLCKITSIFSFRKSNSSSNLKQYAREIYTEFDKKTIKKNTKIPDAGIKLQTLQEKIKTFIENEKENKDKNQKASTKNQFAAFNPELQQKMMDISSQFLFTNTTFVDQNTALRQMESEVISVLADLYQSQKAYGILTNGYYQSIKTTLLAYRTQAYKNKKITKPEILLSETCHPFYWNACYELQIIPKVLKINQATQQLNYQNIKPYINANTICIIGQATQYCNGNCDNIEKLGRFARQKQIGLNVDCSETGLLLPFGKDLNITKYDFTCSGVTSIIIMDFNSPNLGSAVLFKSRELEEYSYFANPDWYGGAYVSFGQFTKNPQAIVSLWISLMHLGKAKLNHQCEIIFEAFNDLSEQLEQLDSIEILGSPLVNAIAFKSTTKQVNTFALYQKLLKAKWNLQYIKKNKSILIKITPKIFDKIDQLVAAIEQNITEQKQAKNPYSRVDNTIYGLEVTIPNYIKYPNDEALFEFGSNIYRLQ